MVYRATFVIILFSIESAIGQAAPQSPIVGIVGGHTVRIEDAPYMASVHINNSLCGGSIIHKEFVLTAAHCVDKTPLNSDFVRVGSNRFDKRGKKYQIAKYLSHEEHDKLRNRRRYDVGLLKLATPLIFGPTIAPIKLVDTNIKIYPGMLANVSGWGRIGAEKDISRKLRQVTVSLTTRSVCIKYFKNRWLSRKVLCAYDLGAGTCRGDSGGPLIVGGLQIGIVSGGSLKHCGYAPDIYVNVTAHLSWINRTITLNT